MEQLFYTKKGLVKFTPAVLMQFSGQSYDFAAVRISASIYLCWLRYRKQISLVFHVKQSTSYRTFVKRPLPRSNNNQLDSSERAELLPTVDSSVCSKPSWGDNLAGL
jgi:hypothetical protein